MSAEDAAPLPEAGRSVVFDGSGYAMKLREGVAFADVVAWAQRAVRAYSCKAERIETEEDPERVVSDGLAFFVLTEDEDRRFGIYAMRCFSGISVLSRDLAFRMGDTTLSVSTSELSRLRSGCKPLTLLKLV